MRDLIGITYDAGSGGPELTAAEWRQSDTSLFVRASNDLVYSGVRGGAVSNTGFSVTIAPLTVVVQPSASTGVYRAAFPAGAAELSKTISAAHATLPRVDAIDVKVYDHEADASSLRGADIVYTAGTAAGSPSAPTFTGQGVRLGTFAVPASGGGNPVWTANPALVGYAGSGGLLDVATRPSSPREGTAIYNRATDVIEYYTGSAWVTLPNGAVPVVASSSTSDSTTGTAYTPGTPEVGVAFVAPPSGIVLVSMQGRLSQNQVGKEAIMSFTVRTGGTVGAGSVVGSSANVNRALVAGQAVVSGAVAVAAGTVEDMFTGLTPGATYNARVEFTTTSGGGCTVLYRRILVKPW